MQIVNQTQMEVELVSASPDLRPDIVVAQVVGKVLGSWDAKQRWSIDWDAPTMILRERTSTPWGDICADLHPRKAGCDLSVVGRIYSPRAQGCKSMEVELNVDDAKRSLRVFGPRRWVRDGAGAVVPGDPEPFGILDMNWAHSFGGRCQNAEGVFESYLFNPQGKGFQTCEQRALGTFLPCIEDPQDLVRYVGDTPMPISLAAIPAELPLNLYPDPAPLGRALMAGQRVTLPPSFHNISHPKFRFETVRPGAEFGLRGMDTEGGLFGALPNLCFHADVRLGERRHTCVLAPSSLVFFPESRRMSMSYSAHFAFRWVPQERRELVLRAVPGGV